MSDIYHVIPVDDLQSHEESIECACKPRIEDRLVIHNAYDGREIIEEAVRAMNKEPEALMFTNTSYQKPQDGQDVWLLIYSQKTPVPARFHKEVKPYYSLLGGGETLGDRHAWAPMEYPTNANTTELPG